MFLKFIENLKLYGLELLGLLYRVYRGKVKHNIDKTFMGRIEVIIEDLVGVDETKKVMEQRYKGTRAVLGSDIRHSAIPISPFAGKNFGFYFPPEEDEKQNIYIVFPAGKVGSTPCYIGSSWHKGEIPQEFKSADGKVQKRGIKTKTGHFILFDESNDKKMEIKSSSGHDVVLSDNGKKIDIRSAGGLLIEMDDNSKKIIIHAGGTKIVLDGSSNKIYLHKDGAGQPVPRGMDLLGYLISHRHIGVHGMTSGPVPAPSAAINSPNVFLE